ncbi:MAG: glycosyltransferase family 39 protein [Myxococcales bacterium]|nr:glycosyltransferase family 39 protein [Myxococcales bacterium]
MPNPRTQQQLWLCLVTLGLLLPFAGKAFHIDDPIFLWTAEQISASPTDFFGFDVNWYGFIEPMYAVNKNPPLVSYYLALVAAFAGWSEFSLHLGMLLPTLALALGIYRLAERFCDEPFLAAIMALASPVFLVSATSLMSDVPMLALWCWALEFFLRGIERDRWRDFIVAGCLMGLCVLAKYFGLALIPLVLVYGAARRRAPGRWLISVALALAIVAVFDLYTRALYGFDPLLDVVGYAINPDVRFRVSPLQRTATGFFFLGGCTLGSALFAPWLWSRRALAAMVFCFGLVAAAFVYSFEAGQPGFDLQIHRAIFAFAGLHLVALGLADFARRRDPESMLLILWLLGVFVFATFTNWTTSGRAILAAIPVVGILLVRRLADVRMLRPPLIVGILVPGLALAIAVGKADADWAHSARSAAHQFAASSASDHGRLYFQGSWGFQRYMEMAGFTRLAMGETVLVPGDRVVMAIDGSNVFRLPPGRSKLIETRSFASSKWIAVMSRERSAGFYASVWGSLPYRFGRPSADRYRVFRMTRSWSPQRLRR